MWSIVFHCLFFENTKNKTTKIHPTFSINQKYHTLPPFPQKNRSWHSASLVYKNFAGLFTSLYKSRFCRVWENASGVLRRETSSCFACARGVIKARLTHHVEDRYRCGASQVGHRANYVSVLSRLDNCKHIFRNRLCGAMFGVREHLRTYGLPLRQCWFVWWWSKQPVGFPLSWKI